MNGKEFSKEIAAALSDAAITEAQLIELIRACEPRRMQIRARIQECQPGPDESTLVRDKALRGGPDALKTLDDEAADLRRELQYLDAIESELVGARERVIDARIRREIPKAKKELPAALRALRDARAALDAAVADANAFIATIAEYDRLETKAMPLDDDALAELLELRAELWTGPALSGLQPPSDGYPRSHAAFYERRGDTFHVRRPGGWLPDFQNDDRLSPSQRPMRRAV